MNSTKNILITGATGFLGSHLLKFILMNTKYSIIVLKRSFSNISRIKDQLNENRITAYDIDTVSLDYIFKKHQIVAIMHCATNYGREGMCADVLKSNLIFPIKLLELSTKYNVELFINTDSYFNKENMSYLYLQNYSLSKKSLNLWLKYFSSQIKIINMILEHIYGDNDNDNKFVATMIDKIAIKKDSEINCTSGEQKRDFIFIEDACTAYITALNYGLKNKFRLKTFDVGTGTAISIKDFVLKIKEISKSPTKINFGAIPYRDDEIMLSVADNIDLINLKWKPKYTLSEGLNIAIKKEYICQKEH